MITFSGLIHIFLFLLSSLVCDPSFMAISFSVPELWQVLYKWSSTRNLETEKKNLAWMLTSIWILGRVDNPKFGMVIPDKCLVRMQRNI